MGDTKIQSCPQCFHENSQQATKCLLCGWSLLSDCESEQTRLCETFMCEPQTTPLKINNKSHPPSEIFSLVTDLSHFEVQGVIGQGGMGTVYHAKDKILQRDVAIKVLRPNIHDETVNVLLDEARIASKLNHPNIVTIYDVARSETHQYIVMEWVEGRSLQELIPKKGFSFKQSLNYVSQILEGLCFAHQKGIIHRDIKPHNLMLNNEGVIKILDFGIASFIRVSGKEKKEVDPSEHQKTTAGTPGHMSPEQIRGLDLDQRSDIFSCGIVFYHMLCGQKPFVGKNIEKIKTAICSGDYQKLESHNKDIPIQVTELVKKMLYVDRSARWQSTTQLSMKVNQLSHHFFADKNWWQRRHWFSKTLIILPFLLLIGWSGKEVIFPKSTQQLIQKQLQEATKVAILPFENISGDPTIQIFSDGLAVNLGSDLAAIAQEQGEAWIIPSTEVSRMESVSWQKVADKYGANLILTGSIQHLGSTRLLVLNLLNTADGQLMKTAEIRMKAGQLFEGHSLVRSTALGLLDWSIPENLIAQFQSDRPQLDGAYKEYVLAKGYLYRHDQYLNLNKALEAFKRAIAIDKNYENAYVGLAEAQMRKFVVTRDIDWLNHMTESIAQLQKINAQHFMLDYLSAEVLLKKGQYHDAIKALNQSKQINPHHIPTLFGLAKAYEALNNFEKVKDIYQQVKLISPNNIHGAMNLGINYFNQGQYQQAIEQFEEVIIIAPNNHWAYMNIGAMYYSLGNIEQAIKYTEMAMQLSPSSDAYSNLGSMYFYLGKYNKAVEMYEKMIELNDKDYINWGNLGDAYFYSNHRNKSSLAYHKATALAQRAIDFNPKDTYAIAHNAYYLAHLKLKEQAIKYAQQIGAQHSGQENFMTAAAYAQLNEVDLVYKHIDYAIANNYSLDEINNSPLLNFIIKDKKVEPSTVNK